MAPIDWDTLTPGQVAVLQTTPSFRVEVGAELLAFDLTVVEDLTPAVDQTQGDIEWDGTALVHRDCSLTIAAELDWGNALVRIHRTVTDRISGLSARRYRGVFCLTAPDKPLGSLIRNAQSSIVGQRAYTVTGQDRTYLLDRSPGYSYVVAAIDGSSHPVTVLAALAQVYSDAGMPAGTWLIDSSAAASVIPRTMTWPLVSTGDDTSSTDVTSFSPDPAIAAAAGSGGAATWRTIINDLHSLIAYRAVWADHHGMLRSTPYADPAARPVDQILDTTAAGAALVGMDRTVTRDVWATPNRWIFIWSNMPTDASGNEQTPTTGNGGVIVIDNITDGPASQIARNGLVWPVQYELTAATATDLATQAAVKVAADKRTVTTYAITVRPSLVNLDHFTVCSYVDDGATTKTQVTKWAEQFDNTPTSVTLESV